MSKKHFTFMGRRLRAFGFDVDDTLLRTEIFKQTGLLIAAIAHYRATRSSWKVPEFSDLTPFIGVSQDQWPVEGPRILGPDWSLIKEARDDGLKEVFAGHPVPWRKGVEECLKWIVEINFLRGRYTTSKRKPMGLAIAQLADLDSVLPVALYGDDVPKGKGKPDPFGYKLLAKQLGVESEELLIVEDSPRGLEAAKASGAFSVLVPGMAPFTDEERSIADVEFPSMVELHRALQSEYEAQSA